MWAPEKPRWLFVLLFRILNLADAYSPKSEHLEKYPDCGMIKEEGEGNYNRVVNGWPEEGPLPWIALITYQKSELNDAVPIRETNEN